MIVKKVVSNSSGQGFNRLADYITREQKEEISYNFTNCNFNKYEDNKLEIISEQNLNTTYNKDKNLHLVVSFKENEHLDRQKLKEIEEELVKSLGMQNHKRISAVHNDTNNQHMHIVINKIDPENLKAKVVYKDVEILQKKAKELEEKFNLERDNHQKNENKQVLQKIPHTLTNSFEFFVKEKISDKLEKIFEDKKSNFEDVKELLNSYNLELKERRNGFVIADKSNKIFCKASSINRDLSKGKLQNRFKVLDLKNDSKAQIVEKFSFVDKNRLYKEYQELENAKKLNKERELKHLDILKAELKTKKGKEKQIARGDIGFKRKEIQKRYKRISYRDFIQNKALKGDLNAVEILQSQNNFKTEENEPTLTGNKQKSSFLPPKPTLITNQGLYIYKDKKNQLNKIIDKGESIKVIYDKKDYNKALLASLKLADSKFEKININGNEEFQKKILEIIKKNRLDFNVKFQNKNIDKEFKELRQQNDKQKSKEKDNELSTF